MPLNVFRPVKSDWLTQGFYESLACAQTDMYGNMVYPPKITGKEGDAIKVCPIGYKDFYQLIGMKSHGGRDYACWDGEPIYHSAEFEGWVKTEMDNAKGLGIWVISRSPQLYCQECKCDHYVKSQAWHCSGYVAYDKKWVKTGEKIALGGSTGASSGPHVHAATKWCDASGNTIHNDNGWFGAIPDDYPGVNNENVFILDHMNLEAKVLTLTEQVKALVFAIKQFLLK